MNEYIKRKDAFEILQSRLDNISQMSYLDMDWHELDIMRNTIENAIDDIGEVPSADVQLVRHGRWVECCNELDKKCSCCDKVHGTIYEREPFCPNCGARMDLEDGGTREHKEVNKPDGNCLDCKFQYLEDSDYWCSICPGNPEDI